MSPFEHAICFIRGYLLRLSTITFSRSSIKSIKQLNLPHVGPTNVAIFSRGGGGERGGGVNFYTVVYRDVRTQIINMGVVF